MKPCCQYLGCNGTKLGHVKFHTWLKFKRRKTQFKVWLKSFTKLDYSQIENVELDGVDTRDYPDFCDAYIASATYKGRDMTEVELERLNEDSGYIYECIMEKFS